MTNRALSLKQVGERLGKGEGFVRGLLKRHELPAFRVGASWRIDERDIEAFIASRKSAQQPPMTVAQAVEKIFDPNAALPEVPDDCRL